MYYPVEGAESMQTRGGEGSGMCVSTQGRRIWPFEMVELKFIHGRRLDVKDRERLIT